MRYGLTVPMVAMVIMVVPMRLEKSIEKPTTVGKTLLPL